MVVSSSQLGQLYSQLVTPELILEEGEHPPPPHTHTPPPGKLYITVGFQRNSGMEP